MVKCHNVECAHAGEAHEYDPSTCGLIDEDADLDENLIKIANDPILQNQIKEYQMYSDDGPLNNIFNSPGLTNCSSYSNLKTSPTSSDTQAAIKDFILKCRSIEIMNQLADNYSLFFTMVEDDESLKIYHSLYSRMRALVSTYSRPIITGFILKLITYLDPHCFVEIETHIKGALTMYEVKAAMFSEDIVKTLERITLDMKTTSNHMTGSLGTMELSIESLRTSTNLLAAASKTLEADVKKAEFLGVLNTKQVVYKNPITQGPTVTSIPCFPCHPFNLATNEMKKLDIECTRALNSGMTIIDRPILEMLSTLGPRALSRAAVRTWNEIKELTPNDPTLTPEERGDIFWGKLLKKYPTKSYASLVSINYTSSRNQQ